MANQGQEHIPVRERDFSLGIDQWSDEISSAPGFVEDLTNVDIIQDRLRKRNGYEAHSQIPITVSSMEYVNGSPDVINLRFPLSVDLSKTPVGPIIVSGKIDTAQATYGGDFSPTSVARYYATATPLLTTAFSDTSGASTTVTLTGSSLGFTTSRMGIGLAAKTSTGNTTFYLDDLTIHNTTYNVGVTYKNTAETIDAYVYYSPRTSSYVDNAIVIVGGSGTYTKTIAGATHSLPSSEFIVEVWESRAGGTLWYRVDPDYITIDMSNSDVEIFFDNNSATYRALLTPVAADKIINITSNPGVTTVDIPSASTPFLIANCYYLSGSKYYSIYPDSINYDSISETHTITFTNSDVNSLDVHIFYEYGSIVANAIQVTPIANITGNNTFSNPQLVVYGLLNKDCFVVDGSGTTNHIDSYRKEGENHLVTSLLGNFFKEQSKDDVSLPSLYPNMHTRASATVTLGPVFWGVSDSPSRTAGYIKTSSADTTNTVPCSLVEWAGVDDHVTYRLTTADLVKTGTPIVVGDILSVDQMSHSTLNGEFKIVSISAYSTGDDYIDVVVENPNVVSSDRDDKLGGLTGLAGIFSNIMTVTDSSTLIPGDVLIGGNLTALYPEVIEVPDATHIRVSGITSQIQVTGSLFITATRTSCLFSLRDILNVASTSSFVPGDVVLGDRYIRRVHPGANEAGVTIAADVVTMISTAGYLIGDHIQIAGYGIYEVAGILTPKTLQLTETPLYQGSAAVIVGYTIELDAEVTLTDSLADIIECERRLYEVVMPTNTGTLAPITATYYFPSTPAYTPLPIQSVMAADNMYLVNGVDPIMKYDGANLYRASLPNFNPLLYARFVADSTGNFGVGLGVRSTTSGYVEAADADHLNRLNFKDPRAASEYAPGDKIAIYSAHSGRTIFTTIISNDILSVVEAGVATNKTTTISNDPTTSLPYAFIKFEDALLSTDWNDIDTVFTLSKVYEYKYYYRLNAIDANNNVIASRCVQSDTLISQYQLGVVYHRLINPPVFDTYDYNHIELQVYRTKGNGSIFYRTVSIPAVFNTATPFASFTDTMSDDSLTELDKTSILLGGEFGKTFDGVPIANYVTSVNNTLAFGNITSDYKLSLIIDMLDVPSLADFKDQSWVITPTTGSAITFRCVDSSYSSVAPTALTTGTNTFTLAVAAHGLAAGHYVYIYQNAASLASPVDDVLIRPFTGYWPVASIAAGAPSGAFTINLTGATLPVVQSVAQAGFADFANDIITKASHGFVTGLKVLTGLTAGTIPAGITNATNYYVLKLSANTFSIYDTYAHAIAGGATGLVNITDAGSADVALSFTPVIALPKVAKVAGSVPVYIGTDDLNRVKPSVSTAQTVNLIVNRMAQAVNAVMRSVTSPWLMATTNDINGGLDFSSKGGFTLTYPAIPVNPTKYAIYANGFSFTTGDAASIQTRYPSRLILSFQNYPELFDNIYSLDPVNESLSAIDINPADGEEITGIIPFFGQTAFGAAMQGQNLVVFKQRSVYLINPDEKSAGRNPIQRLETNGVGCTSPRSIAVSKNAIFFASESGIYALRRDLSIEYIGKYIDRIWRESTEFDLLSSLSCGHHNPVAKKYMVSYPQVDGISNDGVLTYFHSKEEEGKQGAWSKYSNYPATGWCNLDAKEYFSSDKGWLYKTRSANTSYDFADENSAITSTIMLRARDFDNSGIRKQLRHVIAHYRPITDLTGISISFSTDMSETFTTLDSFAVYKQNPTTDLSDLGGKKIETIAHSVPAERGVFFQMQIVDAGLHEGIDFVGVDYLVLPLSHHGIADAASTQI